MTFRMECYPAFDYAREEHETSIVASGATFRSAELSLGLASSFPYSNEGDGAFVRVHAARRTVRGFRAQGDRSRRRLRGLFLRDGGRRDLHADRRILAPLALQVHLHGPLARDGPPLGADPEAADLRADRGDRRRAHLRLPEGVGGVRNWDYRYTWIRDAAFTLYGLLRIGFTEEAEGFMDWLGIALPAGPTPTGRCSSCTGSTGART